MRRAVAAALCRRAGKRKAKPIERLDMARRLQPVVEANIGTDGRHSISVAGNAKLRLTSRWSSVFLLQTTQNQLQFVSDMKRMVLLSTFICFAMICACQKQDSAAEAQLAQRKAELDTREKALDEKEKALLEREKVVANRRIIPSRQARNPAEVEADREKRLQQLPPELRALIPNREQMNSARLAKEREPALQGQTPDPAQAKAERDRKIQQLPPELQALILDRSLLDARRAEKGTATADRAERLRRLEEERRKKMGETASPSAESSDAQPSSPSPSPTPE